MDNKYLDVLRWMAAISVIVVHVAMKTNNEILHYACNWGVPVFVMITGALFLDPNKEISVNTLLRKYILRIVLTIVLAGSILHIVEQVIDGQTITITLLFETITGSFTGKTPQHFWYLYMIVGIYLTTPLVRAFLKSADDKLLKYVITILFIAISLIPFAKQLLQINVIFYLPITSIYFLYFLLGYVFHVKQYVLIGKMKLLGIVLFLIVLVVLTKHYRLDLNVAYHSPIIVVLASTIFLLMRDASVKLLTKYRGLCFNIYLVHPLMIGWLPFANPFVMVVSSFVASLLIAICIQMFIKVIKNIFSKSLFLRA